VSAEETDQINTTAEAIAMVRAIDSPSVRIVLDVKSMSAEETPVPDLIALAAPYLADFQANDANRRGPGLGGTAFVPIVRALARAGYDGDVSVEALDRAPDPETVARTGLFLLARRRGGDTDAGHRERDAVMRAKRLVSYRPGQMTVDSHDVPGEPPPGGILARAAATAISPGTEVAGYLGGAAFRTATSTEPYYPGYSFAG
jgi:hypothetical protein